MRIKIIIIALIVSVCVIIGLTIAYCNYVPDKEALDKGTQHALEAYQIDDDVVQVETKLEDKTYVVVVYVEGLFEKLKQAVEEDDETFIMREYYNKVDAILYIPDSAKAIIGFKGFYKNSKVTLYDKEADKKMYVVENDEITYDCVTELRAGVLN